LKFIGIFFDVIEDFVPEEHVLSSEGLESLYGSLVSEAKKGRFGKVEDA
jgi:hypothetical protein